MSELRPQDELRAALDRILPGVQGPGRYLGLERNLIRKNWEAARGAGRSSPSPMRTRSGCRTRARASSTTSSTAALTRSPSAPSRRWPDMAAAMRERGVPLYSLESYRPVARLRHRRDLAAERAQLHQRALPARPRRHPAPRAARGEGDPLVARRRSLHGQPRAGRRLLRRVRDRRRRGALATILDAVAATRSRRAGAHRDRCGGSPASAASTCRSSTAGTGPRAGRRRALGGPRPGGADARLPGMGGAARRGRPARAADRARRRGRPGPPRHGDHARLHPGLPLLPGRLLVPAGARARSRGSGGDAWSAQVDETGFEEVGLLSLSTADYSQIEPLVGTPRRPAARPRGFRVSPAQRCAPSRSRSRSPTRCRRSASRASPSLPRPAPTGCGG